jgi:hypothetical protein
MDTSAPEKLRKSRSWWRVLAGVLLVFAATLGAGFYLPLEQSHKLLKAELGSAENRTVELEQSLKQTRASLLGVTAEHAELEGFKTQVASDQQRFPKLAEQFEAESTADLQVAFEAKLLEASPLDNGVLVAWVNPALLNWRRSAPSRQGQKLLCASLSQAIALGVPKVTVRALAPTDAWASDVGEALQSASALSIELAESLVRFCKLSPEHLSVASSLAGEGAPLVQFEFREGIEVPNQPKTKVGL